MIDLISKCGSLGHQLVKVGSNIQIENAAHLPDDVRAELIERKAEIINSLDHDEQAEAAGAIIGIPGIIYMWPVSRFSTAYMEANGGGWVAYRESYVPGKSTASSYKVIIEGNTFEYVFNKYQEYINYISDKRKERKA